MHVNQHPLNGVCLPLTALSPGLAVLQTALFALHNQALPARALYKVTRAKRHRLLLQAIHKHCPGADCQHTADRCKQGVAVEGDAAHRLS